MSDESLKSELLRALIRSRIKESIEDSSTDGASGSLTRFSKPDDLKALIQCLKDRADDFSRPMAFEVGDLVTWKDGLKNKKFPAYNEPGVVLQVLSEPVLDGESDASSAYFREPLDLVVGVIGGDDGTLIAFHYDSRRFRKFV